MYETCSFYLHDSEWKLNAEIIQRLDGKESIKLVLNIK